MPCILTVIHNVQGEKTYVNIASISKPMKGMEVKPAINPLVEFSMETDLAKIATLPEWIQKIIMSSVEMNREHEEPRTTNSENPKPDYDDTIPF